VQFLDLSSASLLVKERAEPDLNPALHSTSSWWYASPEQSGKANRSIDSRSDLYSLGAILTELLTGRPPFLSADPLELIHMHLAKAPPTIVPRHFTPATQPLLHPLLRATQAIAHKLLQKQAEDRYQSCQGLIHDLVWLVDAIAGEATPSEGALAGAAVPLSPSTSVVGVVSPVSSSSSSSSSSRVAAVLVPARVGVVDAFNLSSLRDFEAGLLDHASTFRLSQKLCV